MQGRSLPMKARSDGQEWFCTRWNGINKSGGMMDALDDAEYSGALFR